MKNTRWKYLIIILLAIPIVSYIGKTVGEYMAIQQNDQERNYNSQNNLSDGVKAYVAIQDAGAVTEQQMDMNFLKNIELYTAERIKTNIKKSLESKGMSVKNLNIQSESVYVESNGKRFAVIRCKGPDKLISVMVLGFAGNELRRIMCLSETSETIPISYGVCGEKIKEVFGVSMGQ